MRFMTPNNTWERSGRRTVLAMDCVLAGAEMHYGRPLNEIVTRQAHPTEPPNPSLHPNRYSRLRRPPRSGELKR